MVDGGKVGLGYSTYCRDGPDDPLNCEVETRPTAVEALAGAPRLRSIQGIVRPAGRKARARGYHRAGGLLREAVRLHEQPGEVVVLLFFPLAFSSVCAAEICQVAENWSAWREVGATVLGISVDSPFVNRKFAEECGAQFPVLSDFNREATRAYGVYNDDFFGMKGVSNRSVFLIDREGTVRWAWHSEDASVMPDLERIRSEVAKLD